MRSLIIAAFCLALAGCTSKIQTFDQEVTIDPGMSFIREVDGPSKDQKVKIELIGSSEFVSTFVVLSKDLTEKMENSLLNATVEGWKAPATVIAHKLKSKDCVLEVAIPKKEPFKIMFENANPRAAKLRLRISSL